MYYKTSFNYWQFSNNLEIKIKDKETRKYQECLDKNKEESKISIVKLYAIIYKNRLDGVLIF